MIVLSMLLQTIHYGQITKILERIVAIVTVLFIALTLVGCQSTAPLVINPEPEPLRVPDHFTQPVKPRKINEAEYMSLPFEQREQYLTVYTLDLMNNLKQCNNQLQSVRKLYGERP